jgi:short-subunit dehydrogenase
MLPMPEEFRARYGPYALIAGGSEGIGAAFAGALAARGVHLVLIARKPERLADMANRLRLEHGVEVHTEAFDLAATDLSSRATVLAETHEIGLVVYNAAASRIGPFLEQPLDEHLHVIEVNCRGPLVLSHVLGQKMIARGRGGIILMSSLAASQGSPYIASYAASKAFDLVLAESLWHELAGRGVDVLACRAGATRTPAYEHSQPDFKGPVMEPGSVAEAALRRLGHAPSAVAGGLNRLAAFFMGRLMTRKRAIRLMGETTARIYRIDERRGEG